MEKILQEFKQFAMRGNVVDMAVGIIIGGAFGKIVSSIVADLIMPAVGLLVGEQIAISFLPASVGGTLAGSLAACLSVNRMASLLFEQLGISEMNFVVEPWLILLMALALVVFAFAVSMVLAGKIRGITVYGLLTEE